MFKKLLIIVIAIACFSFTQDEKYYVIFIKGDVMLKATSKPLKLGDALKPTDELVFKQSTAKVSCISPGKGRFDIGTQKATAGGGSELVAVLKSNLIPASSSYHLSTRALFFEGYDPKDYFRSDETNGRILLINDEPLQISPKYKVDAENFFFMQYTADGKTVTKKLIQNEKGIIFNEDVFGGRVPNAAMLCYQEKTASGPRSSILAEFVPVLADKAEIKQQIQLFKNYSEGDKKLIKQAIIDHLFDNYGKIGQAEIDKLSE